MRLLKYLVILLLFTFSLFAGKSIEIDLAHQRLYAKSNGHILFSSRISSGKSGHRTPTGNFKILEKDRFHISNKYPEPHGGAKMPYMLRLTSGGIAVHQGYVPNHPASHGCIRVPKSTALKLWRWANVGTSVRVYGDASDFRYAHKSSYKKYAKTKKRYRKYASRKKYIHHKKRYKKRRYAKHRRHYHKRRYASASRTSTSGYKIIEVYDGW
jgi:hypothetical protein